MIKLNVHEIKSQFSKYIDMVEAGETVVVCKRNVPVAELRRIEHREKRAPKLGSAAAMNKDAKTSDTPLSEEELRFWEGSDPEDPLKKYAPKPRKRQR